MLSEKKVSAYLTVKIIFFTPDLHFIGLTFATLMSSLENKRSARPIAIWLLIGVAMLMIQVLLGGITRLTGSGLSITEWKPIMGAIPPLNDHDWNLAFEKYKQIAQFKYLNSNFTLADFKSIFFWEWFHRLWARLIAVAFLIPFIIFIFQKRFKKEMIKPMIILFLLGALQGLVGWIMVQSGLEDSELVYVSHYKLAIHFILALVLIAYALWFALKLLVPQNQLSHQPGLKKFTIWLIVLMVIQLIYGAFMAGLKAAPFAPTWPTINGEWFPSPLQSYNNHIQTGIGFLFDNPLMVHFIHRTLAYIIAILIFAWWWKAQKTNGTALLQRSVILPLMLVLIQVSLGIWAVLDSIYPKKFIGIAVAHQFIAMLLLLSFIFLLYILKNKPIKV
jgi:cytochrome c oxidase assembly protein subunit 15